MTKPPGAGARIAVLAAVFLLLGGAARGSLSVVQPDPDWHASLQTPGGLLDSLYGLGNLQRIDDFNAPLTDQLWFNLGTVNALVRFDYSFFDSSFGYIPGVGDHTTASMVTSYQPAIPFIPNQIAGQGAFGSFNSAQSGDVFRFGMTFFNPMGGPLTWSSYDPENPDQNDHVVTYQIVSNSPGYHNLLGNYVLAWQDPPHLGDQWYNDIVVEIGGAVPVPEPVSGLFLGCAGVALLLRRRRRRNPR